MPEDRMGYEVLPSVIGVQISCSTWKDMLFFGNNGLGQQDADDFDNVRHELGGPVSITDSDDLKA